jgi:formamidopyrimidine-DNA glycosylase
MPELPEVETYARYFAKHALDQTIARTDVRDERILTDIRKETFAKKLKGRAFTHVRRHGKHLFAQAATKGAKRDAQLWLHLHFGMSGDLSYARDSSAVPRFARILFHFTNGAQLAFEDMRLFGLAELVESPDDFIAARGLGPDPLDPAFTLKRFESLLAKRRGAIKALLMTQEIVAGMGNLYVDETLYQTSIHPRRTVDRLNPIERRAVFNSMRKILREAIARHARNAELPPSFLYHHREAGERCPKCGGTIQRAVVFGRTTYFCAKHQR